MQSRPTLSVSIATLRELIERLLAAAGCGPSAAATATDVFLEADLRGVGLQGLDHLPLMIDELRQGKIRGDAEPRMTREGEAFAHVDGCYGPGQLAGLFAADVAVRKGRRAGCCTVGIVNSGDMFMLGYYVERIAQQELVGLAFANSRPRVHPFGGIERKLGTNPIAIAVPSAGDHPVILDFATSALAGGRVRQAAYHEEELPPGSGLGPNGVSTRNAVEIQQGAISPLGGSKGYGLALCAAFLSGPLVGAVVGQALLAEPSRRGHLFIAIDPAAFTDLADFRNGVSAYVQEITGSRKAPGVDRIRMPGERTFAERDRQLREGRVIIDEIVWRNTARLARELRVEMPDCA